MKNRRFIACLLIPIFFSCASISNNINGQNSKSPQDPVNIFIAGVESIETIGGNYFNIQSSSVNLNISETGKSLDASTAKFIGEDLYIVGGESENTDNGYYSRACYWKNGEKYILDPEGKNSRATGIITINNDIYICGVKIVEKNSIDMKKNYSFKEIMENRIYVIVVWKNGEEFTVKDYAFKFVSDSDTYFLVDEPWCNGIYNYKNSFIITGRVNGNAVYWYNGEEYIISENGHITSTFIDGEDVYFSGYDSTGDEYMQKLYSGNETTEYRTVAKYWKNGNEAVLSDGRHNTSANDIFVYKSDVYVIGCESVGNGDSLSGRYMRASRGKVWKNGVLIKEYSSDNDSDLLKIRIVNDDVYLLEYIDGECYVTINENKNKLDSNNGTYYLLYPCDLLVYKSDYYVLSTGWGSFNINVIKTWINGTEREMTPVPMEYLLNNLFVDSNTPYLLYTTSIPRLEMGLNIVSYMTENIIDYFADTLNVNTGISGLNTYVRDIFVHDSSAHIIGSVNNKGRYWSNGNERDLTFDPFKLYVNGDNIWIVGVENKNVIVYKNDEKAILVRDVNASNLMSEMYPDGNDLIIILKYYDLQKRKYIHKIFKNRQEIDVYDFQSSGLYASKVLYKNGIIYSYGVTEGGNYYYSIGNKSYNLLEKRREAVINDFDVKNNIIYMVGTCYGFPSLWKNKERQSLSDGKVVPKFIVVK
jgi:hypothetical protein